MVVGRRWVEVWASNMSFLDIFPAYRELTARLSDSEALRVKADDDARYWRSMYDDQRQVAIDARAEATYALKAMSNWQSTLAGVPRPFPELPGPAYDPPIQSVEGDVTNVGNHRRNARDVQNEAIIASRAEAMKARRRAMNGNPEPDDARPS